MSVKFVWSILFFILLGNLAAGQSTDIDILEKEMTPLEGFGSGIAAFHEAFSQSQLVGLGEATHGTSEFFKIKGDLIKYLVTNDGFNTIIFEGSYSSADLLNEYITRSTGNVYEALIGLGPWCWYTKEVLDIVEWLKDLNSSLPADKKVKFYGCDMQYLRFTVDKLSSYFNKFGAVDSELQNNLNQVKELSSRNKLSKKESFLVHTVIKQLETAFDRLDTQGVARNLEIFHNKRILEQWVDRITSRGDPSGKRDEFMAENISFILSIDGNAKAIVWAHNAHIAMSKDSRQKTTPMGNYLKKQFGKSYFALGFGFNSGSFHAVNGDSRTVTVGDAEDDTSDFQLSKSQYPGFFLDFKRFKSHIPLIHEPTKSRNIGERYYVKSGYRYHTLTESYDGLIFVRDTQASQLLDFNLIK